MKKLGLLSVAAAVALSTSAYAGNVDVTGEARVRGSYIKKDKEANEFYDFRTRVGLEFKNDDGAMLKTRFTLFNRALGTENMQDFNKSLKYKAQNAPVVNYAYLTIPSLAGVNGLELTTGWVDSQEFGTAFTATGDNTFTAFKLSYMVADGLTIGIQEDMVEENKTASKGGILPFSASDDDKVNDSVFVEGKAGSVSYGAKYTMMIFGKKIKGGYTNSLAQVYANYNADGIDAFAHVAMNMMDKKSLASTEKETSNMGVYAGGSYDMGAFKAGLEVAMLQKGFKAGGDFAMTTLIDEDEVTSDEKLHSTEKDNTMLFAVPLSYTMDNLSFDVRGAFGNIVEKSYTEVDLGASYAIGKNTSVSLNLAQAFGDYVKNPKTDSITWARWTLKTTF